MKGLAWLCMILSLCMFTVGCSGNGASSGGGDDATEDVEPAGGAVGDEGAADEGAADTGAADTGAADEGAAGEGSGDSGEG